MWQVLSVVCLLFDRRRDNGRSTTIQPVFAGATFLVDFLDSNFRTLAFGIRAG